MGQVSIDPTPVSDAVNRLGELASHGAATIGDTLSEVGDVAMAVPKSIGR